MLVEILNIYNICLKDTIESIVLEYIALGFIAEIDNLYAAAFQKNDIRDAIN